MTCLPLVLQRFRHDAGGAMAIIFGLSFLFLALCASIALDSSRILNVQSRVQIALDSAALAGAKMLDREGVSDSEVRTAAKAYFDAQIAKLKMEGLLISLFQAVPDRSSGKVTTSVRVRMPSYYRSVAGFGKTVRFNPTANAIFKTKKIELSLVLDITGSMCNTPPAVTPCTSGTKLNALKAAAKELVDSLFAYDPSPGAVRVALVPYSASVNAGSLHELATGITGSGGAAGGSSWGGWSGWSSSGVDTCVVERAGSQAYTDAAPGSGSYVQTSSTALNPRYSCPVPNVVPLSDLSNSTIRSNFKNSIDALSAIGATAGHIGTAWGWYFLSPTWTSVLPNAHRPRAGSEDVIKAVVLMTDGEFNTSYENGAVNSLDVSEPGSSGYQALRLCDAIKTDSIRIYTVSFMAPTAADTMLRTCADSGNAYNADSSSQLMDAFRSIVEDLTKLRVES
ncbi:MAG: pilus assembly protein TadG-related protein [Hyphomicrobium sp.]